MRGLSAFLALALLAGAISQPGRLWAYDLETHRALVLMATESRLSAFDRVLKELGFVNGMDSVVQGLSAQKWAREGAAFEDDPELRVLNHFHDPLATTWDRAGLWVVWQVGQSSILWQQNQSQDAATVILPFNLGINQVGGGNWSWQQTRDRYWEALKQGAPGRRGELLAETFLGLGHLMHLVQDASVPAHTRNDAHLTRTIFKKRDGYEKWVDEQVGTALFNGLLARAQQPPATIFRPTGSSLAPVHIAGLVDTDRYTGSNPDILKDPEIGLAEFSNGNFFSDDTIFPDDTLFGRIPFPARASVSLGPVEDASKPIGAKRRYFTKVRDGVKVNHLAVPSALFEFLPEALKDKQAALDDKVYEDYAAELLPRAVGYSAALLDYFFRGRIEGTLDLHQEGTAFRATIQFTNRTPDEVMVGDFAIYADAPDGTRTLVPGTEWNLTLPSGFTYGPVTLTIPGSTPPGPWILAFRGRLGDEPGAVATTRLVRDYVGWLRYGRTQHTYSYASTVDVEESAPPFEDASSYWTSAPYLRAYDDRWRSRYDWNASPGFGSAPIESTFGVGYGAGYVILHRQPVASGSNIAELTVGPWFRCFTYDSLIYYYGPFQRFSYSIYLPPTPVTAEVVEFEPPRDLTTLFGYTYLAPPAVRRVLLSLSGPDPGPFPVDLGDARLIGLRLTTGAIDPGPLPEPLYVRALPYHVIDDACLASVSVRLP